MIIKSNSLIKRDSYISYVDMKHNFMNFDAGIIKLNKNEQYQIDVLNKEKAVLLLQGQVEIIIWENNKSKQNKYLFTRKSTFNDRPSAIHVDKNYLIAIKALKDNTELIYQATINEEYNFGAKIYLPEEIKISEAGVNQFGNTASRKIIELFSYETEPQSYMVMGEVITAPGNWSSWPPHTHGQPEMYLYRFNKEDGFGASFVGDEVYKVEHNDAVCIPGYALHPTVSTPGYLMYYCWMIPNYKFNPWVERKYDKRYEWTFNEKIEKSKMK